MKKQTEIIIKTPTDSHLSLAVRISIAMQSKLSIEGKVLLYLIKYSQGGTYHAANNSRQLCVSRLKISVDQYKRTMAKLVKLGLIKKVDAGTDTKSTRPFYELNDFLKKNYKNYLLVTK